MWCRRCCMQQQQWDYLPRRPTSLDKLTDIREWDVVSSHTQKIGTQATVKPTPWREQREIREREIERMKTRSAEGPTYHLSWAFASEQAYLRLNWEARCSQSDARDPWHVQLLSFLGQSHVSCFHQRHQIFHLPLDLRWKWPSFVNYKKINVISIWERRGECATENVQQKKMAVGRLARLQNLLFSQSDGCTVSKKPKVVARFKSIRFQCGQK